MWKKREREIWQNEFERILGENGEGEEWMKEIERERMKVKE